MARVSSSRRSFGRPDLQARANVYGMAAGILSDIGEELGRADRVRQVSNANIASIREWGEAENYFRDHAHEPDTFVPYIKNTEEPRWKAISKDIKSRRVLDAVRADFDTNHEKMLIRAEEHADIRKIKNIEVDHGLAIAELEKPPHFGGLLSNVTAWIEKSHETVEHGLAQGLYTEDGAEAEKRRLTEIALTAHIIQDTEGLKEKNAFQAIDNLNSFAEGLGYYGDMFRPDNIAKLKKDYQATKNNSNRIVKEKADLRGKEIQQELWALQKKGELTVEKMNDPEVIEHLSVPEQRTFWNSMNNTRIYTPEEKAKAHTQGIETMVAYRAGQLTLDEAKKTIDKLRSEGRVDPGDGESWTEELLGFKKTKATSSTSAATAMAIKTINGIRKVDMDIYKEAEEEKGEDIDLVAIARRDSNWNQKIIDFNAWVEAEPRTETEINEKVEAMLAPAKEEIAKEVVKRKWWQGPYGSGAAPPFGGSGRDRLKPKEKENPYEKDYPDAYQENGIWYVMKDGKRYRIKG